MVLAACLMVVLVFGYYAAGYGFLAEYAANAVRDHGEPHKLVVPSGQFAVQPDQAWASAPAP